MMKKWLIPAVLLIAAAAWFMRASWISAESRDIVVYSDVVRGPLRMTVQTTGPLRPVRTVPVGSEVSGTVAWLGADFNDQVKEGQEIARLKPELFESRVAQASASYDHAQAAMRKAELVVDDLVRLLPVQTSLAEATLAEAQSAFDVAEYNWNRVNDLYNKGNAPEAEWRTARSQYETSRSARERARLALDRARLDEKIQVEQARQDVALARANVSQAKASLDLARQDLERCTIRAPMDGLVLRRLVSVGEPVVSALTAQHLFIITPDLTRMQLHANVSETDIALVRQGQRAEFTVDACGERKFSGVVTLVKNDPTTIQGVVTFQVLIDVENRDEVLKPEMTANVSILVIKRENALKIDNTALRFQPPLSKDELARLTRDLEWPPLPDREEQMAAAERDGDDEVTGGLRGIWASQRWLWTRENGEWKPVPIWIGLGDSNETEILAGVEAGRRVIQAYVPRSGLGYSVKQAIQLANPGNRSI